MKEAEKKRVINGEDSSISKKDLEKYLYQSKKAMTGHAVFTLVTIILALVVWKIWSPRWWIYLLILWAGPFGLIGDFINIYYCKKRIAVVGGEEVKANFLKGL